MYLSKKVKKVVKANESTRYLYCVIKGFFQREYKKEVLMIGVEKEDEFHIKCLGNKNKGKIIFLYDENNGFDAGFFAIYRFMIEACYLSEQYGFIPVFHWGDNCLYAENGIIINGSADGYGHFFEQPANISYEDAVQSAAVVFSTWEKRDSVRKHMMEYRNITSLGYDVDDVYLKKMAKLSKKYIHLNSLLKQQMEADIRKILSGKKTLAVHVRIKVFKKQMDKHPVVTELKNYIKTAEKTLEKYGFEQIFLATEETDAADRFQKVFGDKCVFYPDVVREKEGDVAYSVKKRKYHKYYLGYEVLRDMHTMALCDGLIAGLSQVSICSQITKLEQGKDFEFKHIFNFGVHHSDFTVADDFRQAKMRQKNANRRKA